MHAIILAAGIGNRLADFNPDGRPKCLLEFDGESLLSRQLGNLDRCGIRHATLVIGHQADQVVEHVGALHSRPEVAFVYNPAYTLGSVLSLMAAHDVMVSGESVLVLDADVLFHPDIMLRLIDAPAGNCFLVDHDFTPGDEPVKIAIQGSTMVEFRKQLPANLEYDQLGESVGFFKFASDTASDIDRVCARYQKEGLVDAPHEEVLRDVLLADPDNFGHEDVSDLPWLEIDFPEDLERAVKQVLPAIRRDIPGF